MTNEEKILAILEKQATLLENLQTGQEKTHTILAQHTKPTYDRVCTYCYSSLQQNPQQTRDKTGMPAPSTQRATRSLTRLFSAHEKKSRMRPLRNSGTKKNLKPGVDGSCELEPAFDVGSRGRIPAWSSHTHYSRLLRISSL